ncbi:MAG: hypothetical protein RR959_06105 [Erysipelotrichaceae bacterium]
MDTRLEQIEKGFIEAMYFMDGANAEFKDGEGFYLDGLFDQGLELSNQSILNIKDLIQSILKCIPDNKLLELTDSLSSERIGNCVYYGIKGHDAGFFDENLNQDLIDLLEAAMDDYSLELYDDNQIHLSYWKKV